MEIILPLYVNTLSVYSSISSAIIKTLIVRTQRPLTYSTLKMCTVRWFGDC